jgi:hypothetical protein
MIVYFTVQKSFAGRSFADRAVERWDLSLQYLFGLAVWFWPPPPPTNSMREYLVPYTVYLALLRSVIVISNLTFVQNTSLLGQQITLRTRAGNYCC